MIKLLLAVMLLSTGCKSSYQSAFELAGSSMTYGCLRGIQRANTPLEDYVAFCDKLGADYTKNKTLVY